MQSADTVKNAVTSVKTLNQLAGLGPVQTTKFLPWHLKGLKKLMVRGTKQATPMTAAILKQIRAVLDETDPLETVTFALCLVGFHLFLRASNLVPSSRKSFDPNKQLVRQDFRMTDNAIVVDIKWSKTAQHLNKVIQVPLLPVANEDICPVYWIQKVFKLVPAGPMDPAFSVIKNGKLEPVSYSQLYTRLKNWGAQIRIPTDRLTPHALRRGGALYAARVDLPGWAIALIGGWASSAYKLYIDWSLKKKFQVLKKVVHKAPRHAVNQNSDTSVCSTLQTRRSTPRGNRKQHLHHNQ